MTKLLTAFLGMLAISGTLAVAEAQDDGDVTAIQGVISGQIDAFRRDAADEAYGYASPSIRQIFPTAERFMSMVRTGYDTVYRPQSFEFLDVVTTPRGPVQRVFFVGPQGEVVIGEYLMQQQPDGSWRINGVTLSQPDDQSV